MFSGSTEGTILDAAVVLSRSTLTLIQGGVAELYTAVLKSSEAWRARSVAW